MSPEKAKQILTDTNLTEFSTGRLYSLGLYLSVSRDDKEATLDGEFTADQLEAIAAWMRDPDSVVVGVGVLVCWCVGVLDMIKRLYKSGSRWALWRWAESPLLYMKRLHLLHTPWGGVMLNFISRPDPWPSNHDHPVNFWSFILRGWYKESRGTTINTSKNIYMSPHYRRMNNPEWWESRGYSVSCINRMVASDAVAHTIYECHPDTLTLVVYGPRKREWGYHTPGGWVGWRQYSQRRGA